ncbi:hypothetical protein B5C34_13585 [Pacificimonas flava]|uniref:Uncharacterized protein n=2 Tax=Pacificimonas TaxID=1960290 RepID=A0A219B9D8_9SPHN|nr:MULTISPECIES: hypothetical protein [Pacificimonas]MBZ6379855.1 hypothetical protein [Pacificimonas aurantium]OWV34388.1 hypothetical protein B5C34_13585 [Pacificimonas flava]
MNASDLALIRRRARRYGTAAAEAADLEGTPFSASLSVSLAAFKAAFRQRQREIQTERKEETDER